MTNAFVKIDAQRRYAQKRRFLIENPRISSQTILYDVGPSHMTHNFSCVLCSEESIKKTFHTRNARMH